MNEPPPLRAAARCSVVVAQLSAAFAREAFERCCEEHGCSGEHEYERFLQAELREVGHNGDADFRGQLPRELPTKVRARCSTTRFWVQLPELHVDLDLAVDLNDDATEGAARSRVRTDAEQDAPVIVQVYDDVQVHLQKVGGHAGGLRSGRHIASAA